MKRTVWRRMSIRRKSLLLVGTTLAAICFLAGLTMLQLHAFSRDSSQIMRTYMSATEFIGVFSTENARLEEFIRPTATSETRVSYLEAIARTDAQLSAMGPDGAADSQSEWALKWAISNAMETYRASQARLLDAAGQDMLIQEYLSMKTQAAYIDSYARALLSDRMERGGAHWTRLVSTNTLRIRLLTGFMAAVAVLLFLTMLALVRELERQSEMEKHLLEKEVEAEQMRRRLQEGRFAQLQSQVKPHFLFNVLNTIAALAREERAPLSESLILRLSRFFRYSLEIDEKTVPLGREIALLRDYMELQETRYGERIVMEVYSEPELEEIPVPKFILQPLVENAILHGLKERASGGHIRVTARRRRRGAAVMVTDNGCGFDPNRPLESTHQSVGLANIRERMELSGGHVDVFSRPGIGTCIRILIGGNAHDEDPDRGG